MLYLASSVLYECSQAGLKYVSRKVAFTNFVSVLFIQTHYFWTMCMLIGGLPFLCCFDTITQYAKIELGYFRGSLFICRWNKSQSYKIVYVSFPYLLYSRVKLHLSHFHPLWPWREVVVNEAHFFAHYQTFEYRTPLQRLEYSYRPVDDRTPQNH